MLPHGPLKLAINLLLAISIAHFCTLYRRGGNRTECYDGGGVVSSKEVGDDGSHNVEIGVLVWRQCTQKGETGKETVNI